jgi:hypothetical protein
LLVAKYVVEVLCRKGVGQSRYEAGDLSLLGHVVELEIKTAFLHGVLPPDEAAYMEQPPSFLDPGKEGLGHATYEKHLWCEAGAASGTKRSMKPFRNGDSSA